MQTALVLDGNAGSSLATVRSLGGAGWRIVVPANSRAIYSRYADIGWEIPEATDAPEAFVDAVACAIAETKAVIVVPSTDASVELLWSAKEAFGDVRILGADGASAVVATDKAKALAAADAAGFPTPEWVAPDTMEEALVAVCSVGFPAVVKPRRSFVREGAGLRQRRHSFVTAASDGRSVILAQREPNGALPVIQAFVEGRSLSVTVVMQAGRVVALVARETLSFDPIAGGTSVWKRTIGPKDVGVQEAVRLLRSIGYEGLGEVEYQVGADGVPRLMEIGVRMHGWVPLAVHAGVDLPLIAARALLGETMPNAQPYRVGAEMRWPHGEIGRVVTALVRPHELPPGMSRRDVIGKAWPPWRPGLAYDGVALGDLGPMVPLRVRHTLRLTRAARQRAAR